MAHLYFQLSCLRLPYLKYLPQQACYLVDVAVDYSMFVVQRRVGPVHFVGHSLYHCQRSEQLVGDVGEYHCHLQAVFGLDVVFVPPDAKEDYGQEQEPIAHAGPPRGVPRRQYAYADGVG